jgi:hypothetical protein
VTLFLGSLTFATYLNLLTELVGEDDATFPYVLFLGIAGVGSFSICLACYLIGLSIGFLEFAAVPMLGFWEESFYSVGNLICQYVWFKAAVNLGT